MISDQVFSQVIDRTLDECIEEDLNTEGDVTTKALFGTSRTINASIISKDEGVLSGVYLIEPLFKKLDPTLKIDHILQEGSSLNPQTVICRLTGCLYAVLAGERIALNFLQHLSGVATHTAKLSKLLRHTGARLLDTRKNTPNLRLFEKKAVAAGGGTNHRLGLYDMILIKQNHIAIAGGIKPALQRAHQWNTSRGEETRLKIEIEVCSFDEFVKACRLHPEFIMLDNMPVSEMKRCVQHRDADAPQILLEASGKVTRNNIVSFADTGVDFISCGSITHSTRSLDIHMRTV